jgi:hypothetical protein
LPFETKDGKNGSCFWAEVASSSVRDAKGRFLYALRVQHDITAARKLNRLWRAIAKSRLPCSSSPEKLQYASSLPDVYDAALDAILAALACERAANRA